MQFSYRDALNEMLKSGQIQAEKEKSFTDSEASGNVLLHTSFRDTSVVPASLIALFSNPLFWKLIVSCALISVAVVAYVILSNPVMRGLIPPRLPMLASARSSFSDMHKLEDAVEVARSFLGAKTLADRAKFVRYPEIVVPFMECWYESQTPWNVRIEDLQFSRPFRHTENGLDYYLVEARDASCKASLPVYLEYREAEGYKVDWAATVSYQPMSWNDFVRFKPQQPQFFRVVVERSHLFPKSISKARHFAYRLSHPDTLLEFYAYLPTYSLVAKDLETLLQDNPVMGAILEIHFPKHASDSKIVTIDRLVQLGWLVDYSKQINEKI